jgi:hypothetical protein
MIPRARFVVEVDPLQFRYSRPEETARLIQSILRKQFALTDVTVTVGAMPARLRCACGCNEVKP